MRIRYFILLLFGVLAASCSMDAGRMGVRTRRLEIVAHRGANNLAPENTAAAARKCVDLGVDYVEVDVRSSSDGVFYILHDKTLDRTTDGTGAIKERPSSYIDTLDAGSWFGGGFKDEKVPRLEPFLNEFRGKIKIYFDVKDADLGRLVELVYKSGFEKDCFFWFSNDSRARELRTIDKKLALKMNARDVSGLKKVMAYDPRIIECRLDNLSAKFVRFCRENDLKIMVHALDKGMEGKYQQIIDSAADMVNLDRADIMVDLIVDSR